MRCALDELDKTRLAPDRESQGHKVRGRVWELLARWRPGVPWLCGAGKLLSGWVVIDMDATLITAHSDKQD